jgi:tetratricopeptide (TPR) repeat protein
VENPGLLAPKDLAQVYFLRSDFFRRHNEPAAALSAIERAVAQDKDNLDYQLQYYMLRATASGSGAESGKRTPDLDAQMYFHLQDGTQSIQQGKFHEALVKFLKAHEFRPEKALPLVKIGDMFRLQNDLGNATRNYRLAAERAPKDINVWSKYIQTLIQSYEWDEANSAMDKFRALPVPQSAIDKAAADMYAKQGKHAEAQMFYRKAMSRDSIDSDVYLAYAKSLMETRHFKEAPFYFALALRFDPLNKDALIGTAKCVAESESIDRAISMLQDELTKSENPSSTILVAIAELYIQKGDWQQAQENIDQARTVDPDAADPWKLQARVYLNQEHSEKGVLDKALSAFQSYSDRNPSDPSGYLERYNVYIKKTEYEKAAEELAKIHRILPKYPKLRFYQGWLYAAQGNHKRAVEEYSKELENNPRHVSTMIFLGKSLIELEQLQGKGSAQDLFNRAMEIAPQNPEAKQLAGFTAFLLKQYPTAIALYNAALVYDQANPLIYKRLGLAYRAMGDAQNAAASFRRYIQMEPDAPDKEEFQRYR